MKRVPKFKADDAAEACLSQDLSDLDYTQFKPMRFELRLRDTNARAAVADISQAETKREDRRMPGK